MDPNQTVEPVDPNQTAALLLTSQSQVPKNHCDKVSVLQNITVPLDFKLSPHQLPQQLEHQSTLHGSLQSIGSQRSTTLQDTMSENEAFSSVPQTSKSCEINVECNYKPIKILSGHTKSISVVKFSPCGSYLGTASADKRVKVWRLIDETCEHTLTGHNLGVNDISWSFDSKLIASVSDDTTVRLFNVVTGKLVRTMKGHTNYVFCCSFNPQSSLIVSGGYDENIRVWDVKTGNCVRILPAHTDPITSVSFNHNGDFIASSSYDGAIRLWDVTNGSCLKTLMDIDRCPITYVSFTPNGRYLVSAQLNSTIKIWDFATGKPVKYYTGHVNEKYCIFANVSITHGQHVISGSEDGKIYIWDIHSKSVIQVLDDHKATVLSTDSHPTKNLIASGGLEPDHKVRIWSYDT